MSRQFTADFFRSNRESLRNLFTGTAPIVITANGLLQSGADMAYPFRQDRNFWYLTGIDEPDTVLVMDKHKEYVILPQREHVQELFSGALDNSHLSDISGIGLVLGHKEGWQQLGARLKKVKHMATLAPLAPYVPVHGLYTNPARAALVTRAKEVNPDIELLDLRQHLATLRMVKQPAELEAINEAITITAKSMRSVLFKKGLKAGMTERDVETELLYMFRRLGADGPAFDSIVAAGDHSCVIHYMPEPVALPSSGVLLLDVGAEVAHYAADISRTYYIGQPPKRMRQVYDAALEVQAYARSLLKPGTVVRDYENVVERYMGEKLRSLGLIKTIDRDSVRQYFPTAASHHLGLDAHDAADYEKPLQPGMVLAVEPGIYIPEEGIGIRVEDNVLITDSGNKVLTASLPHELLSPTMR